MVPLGLRPVSITMVKLILILMKVQKSMEASLIPDATPTHGVAEDKEVSIHSFGREGRRLNCSKGYYLHPSGNHCCILCHKGTYVSQHCSGHGLATNCSECPPKTYMSYNNLEEKCQGCQKCRTTFGQVEVSECIAERDTVCGCRSSQYQTATNSEFFCKTCSACHNGTIRQKCSQFTDTICLCHNGFFLKTKENVCSPCSSCNDRDCQTQCETRNQPVTSPNHPELTPILGTLVVIFGAGCVFLLGWKIIRQISKKKPPSTFFSFPSVSQLTREPPLKDVIITGKGNDLHQAQSQKDTLLPLKAPRELPDCVQVTGETPIPDCPKVLYTVVDCVPYNRWKEFVRLLGLAENTIERIENEQRHSREAQYEMLKKWMQQSHLDATVEHVNNVLNQMELAGCSEAIQEVLARQL